GKELAQIAMARFFQAGDFRSGYYRDQTFMFAIGALSVQEFFAQLYAHTDVKADPASGGRLMNAHFGTRSLDDDGNWNDLTKIKNSTSDISPTAAQMPKLLGLAYASKLFKQNPALHDLEGFTQRGNEVAWGTIGNAATAEGMFFETINAGGVLQVPMIVSVWDDEYGISVPNKYHTTKGSISEILTGFQREEGKEGCEIFVVKGWDYEALMETYYRASVIAREEHVPVIIHVEEMTQPQGHSTSGSHERYKSKERLAWEADHDCLSRFRDYQVKTDVIAESDLDEIELGIKQEVKEAKDRAWKAFSDDIKADLNEAVALINEAALNSAAGAYLLQLAGELAKAINPIRRDVVSSVRKALLALRYDQPENQIHLKAWYADKQKVYEDKYSSHLYSESAYRATLIPEVPAEYAEDAPRVDGREILQACFDQMLGRDARVFAIGEDVGKI